MYTFYRQLEGNHHAERIDQIIQQEQWQIRGIVSTNPVLDDGDAVDVIFSTVQAVVADAHDLLVLVVHGHTSHHHHHAHQHIHRHRRDDDLDRRRKLMILAEHRQNAVNGKHKRGNQHIVGTEYLALEIQDYRCKSNLHGRTFNRHQ